MAALSLPMLMMAQSVVRCDSTGPRHTCHADTRGGIALRYQYSSQGCWQGDTWGYTQSTVWVSNGCKADFSLGAVPHAQPPQSQGASSGDVLAGVLIGALAGAAISSAVNNSDNRRDDNWDGDYDYDGYRRRVQCNSDDMGLHRCGVRHIQYAEVARQYSEAACIYGRTWGYDRNYIWVDRGCRADFWVR